jgi:hypothetical protein
MCVAGDSFVVVGVHVRAHVSGVGTVCRLSYRRERFDIGSCMWATLCVEHRCAVAVTLLPCLARRADNICEESCGGGCQR